MKPSKDISILGAEKFGRLQMILSIGLLSLCILINTINLLRIARRTYRLKHKKLSNSRTTEGRPLINEEEGEEEDAITPSSPSGIDSILINEMIGIFNFQKYQPWKQIVSYFVMEFSWFY